MSDSFSGRPDTSQPASSDVSPSNESSQREQDTALFVPHVFDLVYLARQVELSVARPAMQLYLGAQAVDHSTFLGEGASFEVSCKKMPKSDGIMHTTQSIGATFSMRQGQYDERMLVYKTARIAFTDLGEPLIKDRRAMDSVLMEIYALTHPPLYKHPNIVTLLALGWGTNPYNASYKLPVIVTEYADQGSLAALQAREVLDSETKLSLCMDIAKGLQVLHRCGIVHGDVKSENVLVYSDPQKKYVAKLGDFGFSVVGEASTAEVKIGGTSPWRAPENTKPVPRHLLKSTDIYSYGLTVWRVAMDGINPFSVLQPILTPNTTSLAEATEYLKAQDLLKDRTHLGDWYPQWAMSSLDRLNAKALPDMETIATLLHQAARNSSEAGVTTHQTLEFYKEMYWLAQRYGMSDDPIHQQLKQRLLTAATLDPFYGKLNETLRRCVARDPMDRDLLGALDSLSGSDEFQNDAGVVAADSGDMLLRQSFDHHLLSWQALRDLQPSVQTFVFERFRARAEVNASQNLINTPECFILASMFVNGYGTVPDLAQARDLIERAASNGHHVAQAHLWCMSKVTGGDAIVTERLLKMLEARAYNGSRAALRDITILAPERAERIRAILRDVFAGVGASYWAADLIHGHTFPAWMNTFGDVSVLIKNLTNLNDKAGFKVNRRGDRILHMAASCGQSQAIEALLDNFPAFTVNQLNDVGETPLLSACRSGQKRVVEVLIQRGADPTIVTTSKESPLHWLISFTEEEIEDVGQALIAKDAEIDLLSLSPLKYGDFQSGIDADKLPPGTPLTWAVHHDRPDIIKYLIRTAGTARICVTSPAGHYSPMEWAAHYHHKQCLEEMVAAMKRDMLGFTYLQFLKAAVHSADLFSMVLRHGTTYMDRFRETMNYLSDEASGAAFATGIGGFGYTLLFYAITEGHDVAVEYLLSPETERLLQHIWALKKEAAKDEGDIPIRRYGVYSPEHINVPCGDAQRTPLLECVRWNRRKVFDLLIENGAEINAKSRNPFDGSQHAWSALHTFAHASHDSDASLAERILELGEDVDAQLEGFVDLETPFLVALKNNAFNLAKLLLQNGADINFKCVSSGLIKLEYPTTVLGHIVASAARGSIARLRFLLGQHSESHGEQAKADKKKVDFLVEPERGVTALHRAAWAYKGVFDRVPDGTSPPVIVQRSQYDFSRNRDVMYELLQHFGALPDYMDARAGDSLGQRTALHFAVESCNLGAIELLRDHAADTRIKDADGNTALEVAVQSAQHPGFQCDGPCGLNPLPGRRWHCTICPDHDLCGACHGALSSISPEHQFNEVSLSASCAAVTADRKLWVKVPPEMQDLARIIDLLQARQNLQITQEELNGLHIATEVVTD